MFTLFLPAKLVNLLTEGHLEQNKMVKWTHQEGQKNYQRLIQPSNRNQDICFYDSEDNGQYRTSRPENRVLPSMGKGKQKGDVDE